MAGAGARVTGLRKRVALAGAALAALAAFAEARAPARAAAVQSGGAPVPSAPPASPALPASASPAPGSAAILAATAASDWRPVAPDNLLVMTLADGGRVLIELAPAFAPRHVSSIRALARARWWDGLAIVRVQDNYVVQWGDPTTARPLPPGLPASLAPEWDAAPPAGFTPNPGPDGYAPEAGFADGWPVALDRARGRAWLVHCYGAVGVGREERADSANATELYAVIGHAPRHLDRNVTVVGRVVDGIERLSSLPRGTGPLGFHARPSAWVGIASIRLATDLPPGERPRIEVLRTDTPAFRAWLESRRNRREPFFINPAGHADLCNLRVPVRPGAG
jgi:peptidylprolyl isomerase